jgi:transposase InsO family protein
MPVRPFKCQKSGTRSASLMKCVRARILAIGHTLEWVSWFNHHQLLGPVGYVPPAEAETNYYWQLAIETPTVEV